MKTLTKPVQSRLSSPRIYGYETYTGTMYMYDGQTIVEYGDPLETTWITTYFKCQWMGTTMKCVPGATKKKEKKIDH